MAERDMDGLPANPKHAEPEGNASFRRRTRRRRWRVTSRFYKLLFSFVLVAVLLLYGRVSWEIRRLEQRITDAKGKIAMTQARNDRLRQELDYLNTDGYLEQTAREELGLVKEGETAYMVVTPDGEGDFDVEKRLPEGVDFFDVQP